MWCRTGRGSRNVIARRGLERIGLVRRVGARGCSRRDDGRRREELRLEIEDTIRRFEPRFLSVRVHLIDTREQLENTLRLRIDAVMHAEPAPEAVTFDTVVDPTSDDVMVRTKE